MQWVRKLTPAAYANQRMTLVLKVRQNKRKRNTVIALRGAIHVARFIMHVFYLGVWRHLLQDVVMERATYFFRTGSRSETKPCGKRGG